MTIRRLLSAILALALLLPAVSGAASALLVPAKEGHGCCPSQAAAPEPGWVADRHGDARCGPGCLDQCASCAQCTGPALPVSSQLRCPVAPSQAPVFAPTPFFGFFPPVELRPPRTLA